MTTQQFLQFVHRVQSINETGMQMVYPVTQDRLYQCVNVISLTPVRKAWALLYQFSQSHEWSTSVSADVFN
jgi:hypothetical protein